MGLELTFIPALLVILLAAGAGRLLSKRIRQPMILGELILGMVLGSFVDFAEPDPIHDIAEIGILLLLFSIGLSLDFEEFKRLGVSSSITSVGGIILSFTFGYFAAIVFGFSHSVALLIGTCLVATSTATCAAVLMESRMLRTKIGTLIMGATVVDDVIGVVIMSAVIALVLSSTFQVLDILLLVVLVVLFFLIPLTIGVRLFRRASERITFGRESLLMMGIVVLLLFAMITQEMGISALIGAFVAGLMVGQSRYARRLREYVSMIGGGFFIPIFFVTVGMNFDPHAFVSVGWFAAVLVVVAIVGKVAGRGLAAKGCKFDNRESLTVGVAGVPRAEVALVIAQFGFTRNIMTPDAFSAILVMAAVTVIVTPPLLWKILRRVEYEKGRSNNRKF